MSEKPQASALKLGAAGNSGHALRTSGAEAFTASRLQAAQMAWRRLSAIAMGLDSERVARVRLALRSGVYRIDAHAIAIRLLAGGDEQEI